MKQQKSNIFDPRLLFADKNHSFNKAESQVHEFYLSGSIESADEYIEWFDTIRNASNKDTVKIYINSTGGDLYTTLQFLRVIAESSATIITSVEGACMSAATMIFLHGDIQEVTPHSLFMFHDYSSGTFGKGGEQYDQIQFERAWSKKFMTEVYENFLTEAEIESMMHNKDIWMDHEQVIARLEVLHKHRDTEAQQQLLDFTNGSN